MKQKIESERTTRFAKEHDVNRIAIFIINMRKETLFRVLWLCNARALRCTSLTSHGRNSVEVRPRAQIKVKRSKYRVCLTRSAILLYAGLAGPYRLNETEYLIGGREEVRFRVSRKFVKEIRMCVKNHRWYLFSWNMHANVDKSRGWSDLPCNRENMLQKSWQIRYWS